jgi:hypothetical protein
MGNGDNKSNMLPGSHTYSVARLDVGQIHSISRTFDAPDLDGHLSDTIAKTRRNLAHSATAVFGRVKDKMPERRFTVNTGVLLAADNRLYVTAVIERVK